MEFSERQLEALLELHSRREISEPVRRAIRDHNNGGWNQTEAARRNKVRANTVSEAMKKLKRAHAIILRGYTNYLPEEN